MERRPLKFFKENVGCWRARTVKSRRWIVYRIGGWKWLLEFLCWDKGGGIYKGLLGNCIF